MPQPDLFEDANSNSAANLKAKHILIRSALRTLIDLSIATSLSKGFLKEGTLNALPEVHMALIHSEVSEALEALRLEEPPQSGKIPDHLLVTEELADVVIRCAIVAGMLGVDLGDAVVQKGEYNKGRPMMHGGKRF